MLRIPFVTQAGPSLRCATTNVSVLYEGRTSMSSGKMALSPQNENVRLCKVFMPLRGSTRHENRALRKATVPEYKGLTLYS